LDGLLAEGKVQRHVDDHQLTAAEHGAPTS
jgi:hypothetical protein